LFVAPQVDECLARAPNPANAGPPRVWPSLGRDQEPLSPAKWGLISPYGDIERPAPTRLSDRLQTRCMHAVPEGTLTVIIRSRRGVALTTGGPIWPTAPPGRRTDWPFDPSSQAQRVCPPAPAAGRSNSRSGRRTGPTGLITASANWAGVRIKPSDHTLAETSAQHLSCRRPRASGNRPPIRDKRGS